MPEDTRIEMTKEELKALMTEAVREAFTKMGIDADDPLEMQRDFQHLREWRVAVADVRSKSTLALLGILISGALGALWLGFKALINQP